MSEDLVADAAIEIVDSKDLEGREPFVVLDSDGIEVSLYEDDDSGRCIVHVDYAEDDERWNLLNDQEMLVRFVEELLSQLITFEVGEGGNLIEVAVKACQGDDPALDAVVDPGES